MKRVFKRISEGLGETPRDGSGGRGGVRAARARIGVVRGMGVVRAAGAVRVMGGTRSGGSCGSGGRG